MGLRMKKLEYFWVSLKNLIFFGGGEGGGSQKDQYIEGIAQKGGGTWTFCRFKGELGKKEGVVFLRGE